MFEQTRSQIASTSASTSAKTRANGLVQRCTDEIKAFGANVSVADSSSAASVAAAIGIARAQVASQTFASAYEKWQALGRLDQLAAAVASALAS